ncbi:MAG: MFS transporter [Acidimicrobiia bacterium]
MRVRRSGSPPRTRPAPFRALRVRNYRLFFVGQILSVIGTWTQNTAIAWIVLQGRESSVDLGAIVALQFLPLLVLGVWAGAIADRTDKPRLLQVTNSVAGIIALATALLVSTGHTSLRTLGIMSLLGGVASAFETPARQTLAAELVRGEDLPSAVGLNGAIMTSSRLVGTAIAGVLIATVGATLCLYLNAVSFLAVVVAMQLMRRDQFNVVARSPRGKGQIRQGLRYALGHPEVRVPLAAMAIVGTLAFNQQVTTPLLARITFDAGPGLFAAFGSVGGAGALLGAITAAARRQAGAALIGYAAILLGISALAVALAPTAAVALPLLAIMSFGASMYVSATSTRLQHVADPAFRARVMALNAILFLGSTPVGSVIVSAVSDATNPRVAVGLGGVGALGTGLVVWRRGARRHTGTHGDLAGGPAGAGSDAGARLDVAVKSEG